MAVSSVQVSQKGEDSTVSSHGVPPVVHLPLLSLRELKTSVCVVPLDKEGKLIMIYKEK